MLFLTREHSWDSEGLQPHSTDWQQSIKIVSDIAINPNQILNKNGGALTL